jgi:hypothetical protein
VQQEKSVISKKSKEISMEPATAQAIWFLAVQSQKYFRAAPGWHGPMGWSCPFYALLSLRGALILVDSFICLV